MKIIITIPAYNEERTIGILITKIKEVMHNYEYKILVVDDGSTDKTPLIAQKLGCIVYSHPQNYGLAETFRTEIKKCLELKADIIVHIDADGQYLPQEIPKLIKKIQEGYDLVLGSRFLGKIESMPLIKKIGNRAFSRAVSTIIKRKITDCQTGFRVFTKELAESINIVSTHTYTQEQVIKAVKEKFKIIEVPIYFAKRKDKSRLISHPFEYALKAYINMMRIYRDYEPLKFFGRIGFIFILLGFLLGIFIIIRILLTGAAGGIPRVILSMLLIVIGIQIIVFGFLADMIKR